MNKLTNEQWEQLTREEKREALIEHREPASIYKKQVYVPRTLSEEKI